MSSPMTKKSDAMFSEPNNSIAETNNSANENFRFASEEQPSLAPGPEPAEAEESKETEEEQPFSSFPSDEIRPAFAGQPEETGEETESYAEARSSVVRNQAAARGLAPPRQENLI